MANEVVPAVPFVVAVVETYIIVVVTVLRDSVTAMVAVALTVVVDRLCCGCCGSICSAC